MLSKTRRRVAHHIAVKSSKLYLRELSPSWANTLDRFQKRRVVADMIIENYPIFSVRLRFQRHQMRIYSRRGDMLCLSGKREGLRRRLQGFPVGSSNRLSAH
jgi:hypothetical protein